MFSTPRRNLSPQDALEFANIHLENARKSKNHKLISILCTDADAALSRIKRSVRRALIHSESAEDQTLRNGIIIVYFEHGKLFSKIGSRDKAKASFKKAKRWHVQDPHGEPRRDTAYVSPEIFFKNLPRPVAKYDLPASDGRFTSTLQLAYCLQLLAKDSSSSPPIIGLDDQPDETQRALIQDKAKDEDEPKRLRSLATNLVLEFIRDDVKEPPTVVEILHVAPVLDQEHYRKLLDCLIGVIKGSTLLESNLLEPLAQLLQSSSGHLLADDLVKILEILSARLQDTHQQSTQQLYQLTMAVSHVLDVMADCEVEGLKREQLHAPLSAYLDGLKNSCDPYLVYQAAYAYQALQYVPDDESPIQSVLRRTRVMVDGVSGLLTSFKNLDVSGFLDGLGHLHEGAMEVFQGAQAVFEGANSLINSGEGFVNSLKEGLSFSRKRAWYPALRALDTLLRNGQFVDFKKLVCEAPCRRNPEFQWGLCQQLGEVASNQLWDDEIRVGAIKFLGEMYNNDADWGQQASIKQWIIAVLTQLSNLPDIIINSHARTGLEGTEDSKKQEYHATFKEYLCRYLSDIHSPPRLSSLLIKRAQGIPDVEDDLSKLRIQRMDERGAGFHIPPHANDSLQGSSNGRFPLMEAVKEFLKSDQQVLLLLGESGAGKSAFIRELEFNLWDKYREGKSPIPLHIHLPTIHRPDQDLIAKHLRRNDFNGPQIREMKHNREFILICDGYDESRQSHNLYTSNQLNQPGQWKAKMVISCRTEYLPQDYKDRFQPDGRGPTAAHRHFKEAVIAPFSDAQVQDYIKQYVSQNKPPWQIKDYQDALEKVPNLLDLVKNPFLLSLSLEVLPQVVNFDQTQELSRPRITRVQLYDQFVEHWLERDKRRVVKNDQSPQVKAAFDTLVDGGFTQNGIHFLKELALAIYKEHGGHPVVEYSHIRDYKTWKRAFFSREDEVHILREACPLIRNGNQYRFIHRSLLEYCFTLAIFDPQKSKTLALSSRPARRSSVSSKLSFEEHVASVVDTARKQQPVIDDPLAWRSFVSEPSIVGFLAERVQQVPYFKEHLLELIKRSKTDKKGRIAAANAITILVRAGIPFNGADLRDIQIPGANLNGGQFDSAQLQGADLRKVNFCNAWLRQANLTNAQMAGAQFGEWPYFKEDSEVISSAYSPDGKACAVGLNSGKINVYDTTTWAKLDTLNGHTDTVTSVVYSPSGRQITSGSWDKTVRLWDAQTGVPGPILSGHTERVSSVVYSPSGQQIASGSWDETVRLWSTETGAPGPILSGHTSRVTSVVYSPCGQQIASGSRDKTVRLWDAKTGAPGPILSDHTNTVMSVAYSPTGLQIASGSQDKTVLLWDAKTGALRFTLSGHTNWVMSVVYSPSGHQIATGSQDKTVRLWNAKTGASGPILRGHTSCVTSVMYSPSGHQIASGSEDKTVRLWDTRTDAIDPILSGHSDYVASAVYSPSGQQIVSGSGDETVRMWDAKTGAPGPIFSGHTSAVASVVYSPSGQQIASGSWDETVRLWNTETGAPGRILSGHTSRVMSVVYSPGGSQIASGSEDKSVRLWDVETSAPGPILRGHTGCVTSVVYSSSGNQIASGSEDKTVRLWDAQTGTPGPILTGHTKGVTSVAYSPSGHQIASGSVDMTVRLWDAQTGAFGAILKDHTEGVTSVAYSPDGKQIASGSQDKTVRLWDVKSCKCLTVIEGCHESINSVAWSVASDGTYLTTGCDDMSVRVWRVMKEGDKYHVRLQWSSISDRLVVQHAIIQGAKDLHWIIKRLLRQRGAEGKMIFREVAERVFNMAPHQEEQSRHPKFSKLSKVITAAIVSNGQDSLGVRSTITSMVTVANENEEGPQELKELARRQLEKIEEQKQSIQELKLQVAELKELLVARS